MDKIDLINAFPYFEGYFNQVPGFYEECLKNMKLKDFINSYLKNPILFTSFDPNGSSQEQINEFERFRECLPGYCKIRDLIEVYQLLINYIDLKWEFGRFYRYFWDLPDENEFLLQQKNNEWKKNNPESLTKLPEIQDSDDELPKLLFGWTGVESIRQRAVEKGFNLQKRTFYVPDEEGDYKKLSCELGDKVVTLIIRQRTETGSLVTSFCLETFEYKEKSLGLHPHGELISRTSYTGSTLTDANWKKTKKVLKKHSDWWKLQSKLKAERERAGRKRGAYNNDHLTDYLNGEHTPERKENKIRLEVDKRLLEAGIEKCDPNYRTLKRTEREKVENNLRERERTRRGRVKFQI